MKDIRGLKGTFEGYMWMLDSTGTASQDKIQEFEEIFDKIDLSDDSNKDIDLLETYIKDCRNRSVYSEKKLTELLKRCAKIKTTTKEILDVEELIREIVKLNKGVNFLLDGANTTFPTLQSDKKPEELVLPANFEYNDKNGINNKHHTTSGNYIILNYEQIQPTKKQTNNIGGNNMDIKTLREEIEKLNPTVKFKFYGEDILNDCILTSKEDPSKLVLPAGFKYDKKIGIVNDDNSLYLAYYRVQQPVKRNHNKLMTWLKNVSNKNNTATVNGAVPARTTRKHRGLRALWDKITKRRARKLTPAPTPAPTVSKAKELSDFIIANGLHKNKEVMDYINLINADPDAKSKEMKIAKLNKYVKTNPDEAKIAENFLNKLAEVTGIPRKQKGNLPKMPEKKTLNPNKPITKADLIKNKEDYNLEMVKYIANLKDKNLPKDERDIDFKKKIDAFRVTVENSNKSNAEKIELMRMITVYLANQDRIDYTLDKLTKNEAKLALLNSDKKLETKVNNLQKQLANANTRATAAVVEYNNRIANKATAEELQKANEKMLKTNNEVKKIEKRIKEAEEIRQQIFDKITYIYGKNAKATPFFIDYKRVGYDEATIKAEIAKTKKLLSDVISKDTKVSNIQPSAKTQAKFAKLKANAAKRDAQAYKDIADVKAGKLAKRPDRPMAKIR